MQSAVPVAAGVIIPAPWAYVLLFAWLLVMGAVAIAWLRHGSMDRRVKALEDNHRADRERDRRWELMLETLTADTRNVKEMVLTIVRGHMRDD